MNAMNMTPAAPGIDVERYNTLRHLDPTFKAWADAVGPGTHRGTELRPLDESLTRWKLSRIGHQPWNWPGDRFDEMRLYSTILYTPPAHPEWLAPIAVRPTGGT